MKNQITSEILARTPANEGKVLNGNFGQKAKATPLEKSDYIKLLENAKRSVYARFFPMRKMTNSEQDAFEKRIDKLIDIIAEEYDEDLIEDSKEEANYLQRALIHSERY